MWVQTGFIVTDFLGYSERNDDFFGCILIVGNCFADLRDEGIHIWFLILAIEGRGLLG